MRTSLFRLALLGVLLLAIVLSAWPVQASSEPDSPCTIDFYMINTIEVPVEYDVTNWTIGDVVHGTLDPGEVRRYSLPPSIFPPGSYEFFATDQREWDIFEWVYLPACSRVAMYIKLVKGQPVLKVKVVLPETDLP